MSETPAPKPFIYLAVPCYGGVLNLYFVNSMLALQDACRERGILVTHAAGLNAPVVADQQAVAAGRVRAAFDAARVQAQRRCMVATAAWTL